MSMYEVIKIDSSGGDAKRIGLLMLDHLNMQYLFWRHNHFYDHHNIIEG